MAAITTQVVGFDAINATYQAAVLAGDTFSPGDGVELVVKNGSGSSMTYTITTPGTQEGLALADKGPVTVPAGGESKIKVPARLYAKVDGQADIVYSAVTTVTVGVFKVS